MELPLVFLYTDTIFNPTDMYGEVKVEDVFHVDTEVDEKILTNAPVDSPNSQLEYHFDYANNDTLLDVPSIAGECGPEKKTKKSNKAPIKIEFSKKDIKVAEFAKSGIDNKYDIMSHLNMPDIELEINGSKNTIQFDQSIIASSQFDWKFLNAELGSKNIPTINQSGDCYKCLECTKVYASSKRLALHIERIHGLNSKRPETICQICSKEFPNEKYLNYHVKSCHEKNHSRKFMCAQCNYRTTYKSVLKKHVSFAHEKNFTNKCDSCSFATYYKCKLREHVRTVHEKIKKYTCQQCNSKFSRSDNLKQHVESVHLKVFRFLCQICPFKTQRERDLVKHLKNQHIEEFM